MTKGLNENYQRAESGVLSSPLRLAKMDGFLQLPSNSRLKWPRTDLGELITRQAAFLDRDGVLVEDVNFMTSPDQLRILPGVANALGMLRNRYFIIVITNQSGIARGLMTEEDLAAIHTELVRRFADENVAVDALYYCPHLPGATNPTYGVECECRTPRPGMLKQAASDWDLDLSRSFLVGDRPSDIQAADAAGVKAILLREAAEEPCKTLIITRDLLKAADLILAQKQVPATS